MLACGTKGREFESRQRHPYIYTNIYNHIYIYIWLYIYIYMYIYIGVILALSFYLYVKCRLGALYFVANKTKYNLIKSFV